jgi:hypothetical protein
VVTIPNRFEPRTPDFQQHSGTAQEKRAFFKKAGVTSFGETDPVLKQTACPGHRSNMVSVLTAIKQFFKDNPTWD